MPREDCCCAVELFRDEDTDNLMRPCHSAECKREIGAIAQYSIMSGGTANGEEKLALSVVAKPRDGLCESFRRHCLAPLIKQDQAPALIQRLQNFRVFSLFA